MVEKTVARASSPVRRSSSSEADAVISQIAQSIDVARLQFKRLRKDLDDYNALTRHGATIRVFGDHPQEETLSKSRESRTAIYADVHFLLMSLHDTDKMLSRLKVLFPREAELANLRNRHRALLRYCEDFRTHMEHFDSSNGVEDCGNLHEYVYNYRGRTLNLGPELEQTAESFFSDLMSVWLKMSARQRKIRDLISRTNNAG